MKKGVQSMLKNPRPVLIALAAVLLLFVCMTGVGSWVAREQQAYYVTHRQRVDLRDLARWLTMYLSEHEGRMPESWAQLEEDGFVECIRKEGKTSCRIKKYGQMTIENVERFSVAWGIDVQRLRSIAGGYVDANGREIVLIRAGKDNNLSSNEHRNVSNEIVATVQAFQIQAPDAEQ